MYKTVKSFKNCLHRPRRKLSCKTTCWAKVGEKLERTSTSSRAQKAEHSTPVPCVFDLKTVEKK